MRRQGRFISDRKSARECLTVAMEKLIAAIEYDKSAPDTAGHANRLNDYVREAAGFLRNAEKLLEQRGANDV